MKGMFIYFVPHYYYAYDHEQCFTLSMNFELV